MPFPAGPEALDAAWIAQALAGSPLAPEDGLRSIRVETIGVGYGLDGTVARVTLDLGATSPRTVIAKWCGADQGRREAAFYRRVAPELTIGLAALHAALEEGDRALLLLSDVAPARQGDALIGATPAEAAALAETTAAVHAPWWGRGDDPALEAFPRWGARSAEHVDLTTRRLPRFLEREGERLAAPAIAAVRSLPHDLPRAYAALREAPVTLVHNDLHLDNVLFRPDGTPVVIDWAAAARGPAAVDVARILVEAMTVAGRRSVEDAFLATYGKAIARRGVRAYSRDALVADVGRAFVVALGSALRWIGSDEGPDASIPRLVPVVENLLRNAAAAVVDWTEAGRIAPGCR